MKLLSRSLYAASLFAFAGQSLAMDTSIERAGMMYAKIPLTKKFMRSNDTAVGFRFGQARFSTDSVGSLLSSFKTHPAMVEMEFRPTGRFGDISFRLQEFKLNGISSLEKQYINGGLGFIVAPAAVAVMTGLGAVGAVGLLAASSSDDSDSDDDKSTDSQDSSSKNDDDSSDDSHDEIADDDSDDDLHDDDHAENDHDDDHDEDHDDDHDEDHDDDVADDDSDDDEVNS